MPTDDLDMDGIVEKCRTQSSLTGMISSPGNMFRSVTKLAEEVKRLRVEQARFHECEITPTHNHRAHGEFITLNLKIPVYHREGDMATIAANNEGEG